MLGDAKGDEREHLMFAKTAVAVLERPPDVLGEVKRDWSHALKATPSIGVETREGLLEEVRLICRAFAFPNLPGWEV